MPADLTTVLGRLLSERGLRDGLRRDPEGLARELDVEPSWLEGLNFDDLHAQAEALLNKRFEEVSRILPQTLSLLGATAVEVFRAHAEGFWPAGHRRHVEDALAFGRFLEARGLPCSASELHRLRFSSGRERLSLRWVSDALAGGRRRRALQVLYRRWGVVHSLAFYLGF